MQCQSECQTALRLIANISKPFEKRLYGYPEIIYGDTKLYNFPSIGQIWWIS